jgi:ankyrin repeat protein
MDLYEYTSIDLEDCSFRLVRLLSGVDEIIRCELFDAWLHDKDGIIEYDALSYTWGGARKPDEIEINRRKLAITENLCMALKHLRYPDRDRILWIDAICIDQGNDKERGHQVQQMGSIYTGAEQVVVWLGRATPDTDLAFRHMYELQEEALKHACNGWKTSDQQWQTLRANVQPLLADESTLVDRQRNGLISLLNRSWFKRVWILQEVANARSAKIMCGSRSVSARIFAIAPALVGITPDPHCQAVLDIMPGPSRKYSWWTQNRDLHTLLLKFSGSEASDSRDIVYALLGISSDGLNTDILVPDYEKKTLEDVIHDAIAFILRFRHSQHSVPCLPRWNLREFLQNLESLGSMVFIWATENNHTALSCDLVDKDMVDVNFKDERGLTPFWCAAQNGNTEIVKLLLETGKIDVDSKDAYGRTPLLWAIATGHQGIVKLLLDMGKVDFNLRDSRFRTPLFLAVEMEHEAVVKLLLDTGKVDANSRDDRGRRPLLLSAEMGNQAIVKLLLDTRKIEFGLVCEGNETPLSVAAKTGHETVVKLLLDIDEVDVDSRNRYGKTPLFLAVENRHDKVVKMLLDTGKVDVDWAGPYGQTLLSLATETGNETVVKLLLDTGKVNVNSHEEWGETPLFIATRMGHGTIVKLLLDTGKVDVNMKNKLGETPMSWAKRNDNMEMVEILAKRSGVRGFIRRTGLWRSGE